MRFWILVLLFLEALSCGMLWAGQDTIRIMAVGDMMLGNTWPDSSRLKRVQNVFQTAAPILQTGDVVFGNLEGVIGNSRLSPRDKCKETGGCYLFRMPIYMAKTLRAAGFNLLSVANNHSGDFGEAGRRQTAEQLDSAGIYYAGWKNMPVTRFKVRNLTVGFCAFSNNTGCLFMSDTATVAGTIRGLNNSCDIVIVSFHGGKEGENAIALSRKTEFYLDENRGNPYLFAQVAIDAGADLVLGHGPHVPRALAIYKDRLIAYSLGNFATLAGISVQGYAGLAPILEIQLDENGKFLGGQIHAFRQRYNTGPIPDTSLAVIKLMDRLSRTDFPESPLMITPSGRLVKKGPASGALNGLRSQEFVTLSR